MLNRARCEPRPQGIGYDAGMTVADPEENTHMAAPVKFDKPKKPAKPRSAGGDTSFNFGFNVLSKTQKRAYNRRLGKRGSAPGGGS